VIVEKILKMENNKNSKVMIQVTKGKMKLLLTSEDMCGFMCRK